MDILLKMLQDKASVKNGIDSLLAGAFVGAFTTVLNNPLDVIKSRIQADYQVSRRLKTMDS